MGLFGSGAFYTTNIRKIISEKAFDNFKGACRNAELEELAIYWSWYYDETDTSQLIQNAHTHAMSEVHTENQHIPTAKGHTTWSNRDLARQKWLAFINENVANCSGIGLGLALHATQDHYAEGHENFASYNGLFLMVIEYLSLACAAWRVP